MKFKNRQSKRTVVEIRISITSGEENRPGGSTREPCRVLEMSCILIWVEITQVHTYVKIHQAVHLSVLHFALSRLHLKTKVKIKIMGICYLKLSNKRLPMAPHPTLWCFWTSQQNLKSSSHMFGSSLIPRNKFNAKVKLSEQVKNSDLPSKRTHPQSVSAL